MNKFLLALVLVSLIPFQAHSSDLTKKRYEKVPLTLQTSVPHYAGFSISYIGLDESTHLIQERVILDRNHSTILKLPKGQYYMTADFTDAKNRDKLYSCEKEKLTVKQGTQIVVEATKFQTNLKKNTFEATCHWVTDSPTK